MNKQDVLDHFATTHGGQAEGVKALAGALGISREAIYQWPDPIPLLRAYQIERLTRKKLRVSPDVPRETETRAR